MATSPILRPEQRTLQRPRRQPKPTSLTLFPPAARHGNRESPCGASAPPPASLAGKSQSKKPAEELVGIARLAAISPRTEAKRGTEYFLLPVRSILNRCQSERVPFRWTVNPYRGCEFGCKYCYARYTHEYMELDGGEFESKIFVKQNAGELAEQELSSPSVSGEHIAIGAATDPYQPAEREFGVTRAILERMAAHAGLSISITTKSNQVVRDIDLLRRIAERSSLVVNLSITTLRTRLARLLEPRAPRPDLRLDAVRKLNEAGIAAGVFAMPVLPGLTDREDDLDALARGARDAGAKWFAASVLFLMPASLKQFMPFIERNFPRLAAQYKSWYARPGYAPESYAAEIGRRVKNLREKYGLGAIPRLSKVPPADASPQLALNLSA